MKPAVHLVTLAVATALLVGLAHPPAARPAVRAAMPFLPAPSGDVAWPDEDAGRLVFFAVLEGLFLDGVRDTTVAVVLDGPADARTPGEATPDDASKDDVRRDAPAEPWERELERSLFVPGCPLCAPVHAAFETYRARGGFGVKPPSGPDRTRDAFGPGLPADIARRLAHPERAERLAALQPLIARWVDQALDRRRATLAERSRLAVWMEDARKRGMWQLQQALAEHPEVRATWRACASCDGAVDGVLSLEDAAPR